MAADGLRAAAAADAGAGDRAPRMELPGALAAADPQPSASAGGGSSAVSAPPAEPSQKGATADHALTVGDERAKPESAPRPSSRESNKPSMKLAMPMVLPRNVSVSAFIGKKATWQWKHRTGFKDYSQEESDRLESYFQAGEWMMRMKSGRGKNAKPREIYFYDMVQYDPGSGSLRELKRLPEMTRRERFVRRLKCMHRSFFLGLPRWWQSKSKAWYEEQREVFTDGEMHREHYRLDSAWYKIINLGTFEFVTMSLILANAMWLFFDADLNDGTTVLDTDWGWIIGENFFCAWFTLELLIRFMAFKKLKFALADSWFCFDLMLVSLMIFETWILQLGVYLVAGASRESSTLDKFTVLRSLRLMRLVRITRLFKVFPELFVLTKGVVHAMRSLIYTLIMLFVITFICGVIFSTFGKQNESLREAGFDKVADSMWTLLLYGVFMDAVSDILNVIKEISMGYATLFLIFIFLSNLTMLNMLIGILCEVVTRVTQTEMDESARSELEARVTEILECYDVNDNSRIQRHEFQMMTSNPDLKMILRRHDIEMADLIKLEDVLFKKGSVNEGDESPAEEPSFGFSEFLEKVFQFRGGNMSTVNDIVEMRSFVDTKISAVTARFRRMEEKLNLASPCGTPVRTPRQSAKKDGGDHEHDGGARKEGLAIFNVNHGLRSSGSTSAGSADFQAAVLAQLSHLAAIREDQAAIRENQAAIRQDQAAIREDMKSLQTEATMRENQLRSEVTDLSRVVRDLQESFATAVGPSPKAGDREDAMSC